MAKFVAGLMYVGRDHDLFNGYLDRLSDLVLDCDYNPLDTKQWSNMFLQKITGSLPDVYDNNDIERTYMLFKDLQQQYQYLVRPLFEKEVVSYIKYNKNIHNEVSFAVGNIGISDSLKGSKKTWVKNEEEFSLCTNKVLFQMLSKGWK